MLLPWRRMGEESSRIYSRYMMIFFCLSKCIWFSTLEWMQECDRRSRGYQTVYDQNSDWKGRRSLGSLFLWIYSITLLEKSFHSNVIKIFSMHAFIQSLIWCFNKWPSKSSYDEQISVFKSLAAHNFLQFWIGWKVVNKGCLQNYFCTLSNLKGLRFWKSFDFVS